MTIRNIDDDHELNFKKTFFVPESYYAAISASRKPQKGDILYSVTGSYGIPVMVRSDQRFCFQRHIALIRTGAQLNNAFLHCLLSSPFMLQQADQAATGVAQKTVSLKSLRNFQIPLPPLAAQQTIVAEIEGYKIVVNGAHTVLDNYRPHIPIHPDWPTPTFAEAPFEIIDGDRGVNYPKKEDFSPDGYCVFLSTRNVRPDGFKFDEVEFITREKDEALRKGKLRRGDVLLTTRGTIGNTGYYDNSVPFDHVRINSGMLIFRSDENELSGEYLYHFFQSQNFKEQRDVIVSGAAQPQLPIRSLNEAKLPLPDLETQKAIVAEIEAEKTLVAANRELIERFEKKIQTTLGRVWGEDDTAIAGTQADG